MLPDLNSLDNCIETCSRKPSTSAGERCYRQLKISEDGHLGLTAWERVSLRAIRIPYERPALETAHPVARAKGLIIQAQTKTRVGKDVSVLRYLC